MSAVGAAAKGHADGFDFGWVRIYTANMATIAPPVGFKVDNQPLIAEGRLFRISRERYHEMIETGLFDSDDEYELIHGYLLKKMARNQAHIWVVRLLVTLLRQLLTEGSGWFVVKEDPIALYDSEPEPDVVVVRGSETDYWDLPEPQDIGLVVEVSDSTLSTDRSVKKPLYAQEGIREYWIVDVKGRRVEVYTEPFILGDSADYRHTTTYTERDEIEVVLDGKNLGRIPLTNIFPPTENAA